jgi:hypothetical protein
MADAPVPETVQAAIGGAVTVDASFTLVQVTLRRVAVKTFDLLSDGPAPFDIRLETTWAAAEEDDDVGELDDWPPMLQLESNYHVTARDESTGTMVFDLTCEYESLFEAVGANVAEPTSQALELFARTYAAAQLAPYLRELLLVLTVQAGPNAFILPLESGVQLLRGALAGGLIAQ